MAVIISPVRRNMSKFNSGKATLLVIIASMLLGAFFLGKTLTGVSAKPKTNLELQSVETWSGTCVPDAKCGTDKGTESGTKTTTCVANEGKDDGCVLGSTTTDSITRKCKVTKIDCPQITLCHSTGSDSNPYNIVTIDDNAITGGASCDLNGHGLDASDIIPAFTETNNGCGFTARGDQAILKNGCEIPGNEEVDGACGITVNSCTAGTFSDTDDSSKDFKWDCLGIDGGKNDSCKLKKSETPIDVCANIPEDQATVPAGYHQVKDNCYLVEGFCPTACGQEASRVPDGNGEYKSCDTTNACENPSDGDLCTNIPGVQKDVPEGMHINSTGHECENWSGSGPAPRNDEGVGGAVLGASTGKVLGASTMAGTGTFSEIFYQAIMGIGATLSAFGIKGLKKSKKAI